MKVRIQPSSAPIAQSQSIYDQQAERHLLDLANRARGQAGLPPLHEDEGLKSAARAHAQLMAGQRQLSHRFAGEDALAQRLAGDSDLHLDQSGENVAYSGSADQAHDSLMKAPAHRENRLSPDYNTAGFGVVRRGNLLYITQDFAHSLPKLSAQTAEETVAANLNHERSQMGLPPLQRLDGSSAHATACSMAQASLLKTSGTPARYILRYTSMEPSSLPPGTAKATHDRDLRAFSVGACYSRSAAYPTGAYWVVVQFF